ncbi:MAG TPA: adenosine deaminase, partial [Candidatus Eisenbacteria bacterium]
MRLNRRILQRLPKTDLHCHLDGCLRPRTMLELAAAQGVKLPTRRLPELTRLLQAGRRTRNLRDYLEMFEITLSVMQERDALYRVARELVEDAARENVRHLEVRYCPILHRRRRLSLEDIIDPVISGLSAAGRRHNLSTGVIICGIRSMSPKVSVALAELAVAYKGRGVLAFDLAGQEKDYPAKAHRDAFQLILKNNINSTVHAGEAFGPASIGQALHHCGAHRIGHGTRLHEDTDLLNYVNDHRIPLEMCLSSNVQTRAVKSLKLHPFGLYFRRGLRVTLNTDSRLISATTVSDEVALAIRTFHLGPYEVKRILINGFKSAFLPYAQKARVLREV